MWRRATHSIYRRQPWFIPQTGADNCVRASAKAAITDHNTSSRYCKKKTWCAWPPHFWWRTTYLFYDSLEDPDGFFCGGRGTGWLIRHRNVAEVDDTRTFILLNQDGSQNGSGQDCGASRLCALSRDSTWTTTVAAAAAATIYGVTVKRAIGCRVMSGILVVPTAREHVVSYSDRHGCDYDMIRG